jgi:hypothetical protein
VVNISEEEGDKQKSGEGQERVMGCEYDQSSLHTCMKMLQCDPLFCII